jgi:EmrB/QacA subfamily drug resistance transporter
MDSVNPSPEDGLKNITLLVIVCSNFLVLFAGSSINIAFPSIGKEFSMNAVLLSWVASAYILAGAILLVPIGRLGDIYGRKRIFMGGIWVFTISSFFLAISRSAAAVICFRIFQGTGSAMIFGMGDAILTSLFPASERGKVLGISVASVYLGLSTGPVIGGILTEYFGWRSIFILNVPVGLLVSVFTFLKWRGQKVEGEKESFDFPGTFIYALALMAIMYGFTILPKRTGFGLLLIGAFALLGFVFWEGRAKNPVLNLNLFRRNTVFALSNLAALINYSSTYAVGFLLSLYLQYTKGLSPEKAGMVLIAQPIIQAVCSPIAGHLSDRVEPRIVSSIGMALSSAGLFMLVFLNEKTALGSIVATLIFFGFGYSLFSSPNINAVMSSVEKRFLGVASATLATMRMNGQMLSMGISTLVFSIYLGTAQITPESSPLFLKSVRLAFGLFAFLCLCGVFASLARGKLREENPSA